MADEALSGGTVSLPIKPDTSNFGRETEKGIAASLGGRASGFANIGKTVGLAIGAAAAAAVIGSVVAVARTGIQEALDASAGQAQLEAGIKSTGNAANVTVKSLEGLAGSLQGVTGQTDDSIVKAEQLLLTFTNIRNVGADKIFDQATKAASDMAAKFGGDASSQAIVLGKALNDPVKGVTALTRVGVSFTQGQKDTIKAMVETGDTIGAQKVILGELTKEFGGAGEAAGQSLPGQLAIAQRSFEDFSQGIVETFIPIVLPILKDVLKVFQDNAPAIQDVSTKVAVGLKQAFSDAAPFIKDVGNFFHDTVGPSLGNALDILKKYPEVVPLVVAGIGAISAAAVIMDAAFDANPIGAVVLALEGVAATTFALTTNFGGVTVALTGIANGALSFALGIKKSIDGIFIGIVNGVIDVINTLEGPMNAILVAFGRPSIKLGHISNAAAQADQFGIDLLSGISQQSILLMNPGTPGTGGSVKSGKAMATGGTVPATPGGTLVRMSEAGRTETVVDTESLNRVADLALAGGSGGPSFTLVNPDPYVLLQMLQQKMAGKALGGGRLR